MRRDQVAIGAKVRSRRDYSGVPKGTIGMIDQVADNGNFSVAWDLADRPLPTGWVYEEDNPSCWAASPSAPLRDGFNLDELEDLEVVFSPKS